MLLVIAITAAACLTAFFLPTHWGAAGFLGAALSLFVLHAGLNTAMGFAGTSIEESLLLFNGSWMSYFGFNLQITYRAFTLPLLAVAAGYVWRLAKSHV